MGTPSYTVASENKEDVTQSDLDCKDFALRFAYENGSDMRTVRGYALLPVGKSVQFTEHWWCETKSGLVVDVTDLASLGAQYKPLVDLDGPEEALPTSFCDAMAGPCETKPTCAWCKTRFALERKGLVRARIKVDTYRVVFEHILSKNRDLQEQLRSARLTEKRYAEALAKARRRLRGEP